MSSQALLDAQPPATDTLTYLTILSYNLTRSTLPTLVTILREDPALTREIGWDLIGMLVPLLPFSREALEVVVESGNGREVLLKVCEALSGVDFLEGRVDEDEDEEGGVGDGAQDGTEGNKHASSVMQTRTLLSLLPRLHARLDTKKPSRFLSTTLQAVLAAFSNADGAACEALYPDILAFTSDIRAALKTEGTSEQETAMQKRLLHSFVTHVWEVYVLTLSGEMGDAVCSWSSRVFERAVPGKKVPGKPSIAALFESGGARAKVAKAERDILELVEQLGLGVDGLLDAMLIVGEGEAGGGHYEEEEDPPDDPDEVPLSAQGCLFLLASLFVRKLEAGETIRMDGLHIFNVQSSITSRFIGVPALGGLGSAGSEPSSTIDAVLALSLLAVVNDCVGKIEQDEEFTKYLQVTSLLSANTPMPDLRYVAHYITSTILHLHPSDHTRLAFIRDTLEHCPYENLKASAVEWFKSETMSADTSAGTPDRKVGNLFSTPAALETISTWLFPDQRHIVNDESEEDMWMLFNANLSFNLAALNFYLFLFLSSSVRARLQMVEFHQQRNMKQSYLDPFRAMLRRIENTVSSGAMSRNLDEQDVAVAQLDVALIDNVLTRIEGVLGEIGLA